MQILDTVIDKQVIERSEFIAILKRCFSIEQAKQIVEEVMIDYPNATHYCYAYLLANNQFSKSNDNGEPSGTAGSPILQVLLKNQLDNVICVVVRYFGGIKLGAGGLIRAYSSSCANAVNKATLTHFIPWHVITFDTSYDQLGIINNITSDQFKIVDTQYSDHVTFTIHTTIDLSDVKPLLDNALKQNVNLTISDDLLIETPI